MKTFKIGDRFIDDKGLIVTVVQSNVLESTNDTVQHLKFDNNVQVTLLVDTGIFVKDCYVENMEVVLLNPFIIEDGRIYLTNAGDELEFKVIQDNPDDFAIYVSDEGTQYSSDGQYVVDGPESLKALNIAGLNNDHVKSVLNERKFKQSDFVDVKVSDMESIPPNGNPFHYDLTNMGTTLLRGWTVMHEGFFRDEDPQPAHYLILVNTISGQRLKLDLTKRQ